MKLFKVKFTKIVEYTKEFLVKADDSESAKKAGFSVQKNTPNTEWDLEKSKLKQQSVEELGDESDFDDI